MKTERWGSVKPPNGWLLDRQNSLKHYYLFNEGGGSTAYDYSGNSRTAIINSGNMAVVAGSSESQGWAFSPNGTQYLIAPTTLVNDSVDFTIVSKIFVSTVAAGTVGIISIGDATITNNPYYLLQRNGTQIRALLGNISYVNLITTAEVHRWYTIISKYLNATEIHYVDGIKVYEAPINYGLTTTDNLYIGIGFNGIFEGGIEYLGIWSKSLEDYEVFDITNNPYNLFPASYHNVIQPLEQEIPSNLILLPIHRTKYSRKGRKFYYSIRRNIFPITLSTFLQNSISDELEVTEDIFSSFIYTRFIDDTPSVDEEISFTSVFSFSTLDSLEVTEDIQQQGTIYNSTTDTETISEVIDFLSIYTRTLNDSLSITENISFTKILNFDFLDTLNITEIFRPSNLVTISFTTLGNSIELPEIESLTIFPYNYIDPISYGETDYSLMVASDFNYSTTSLFRITLTPTLEQRQQMQRYFSYWRTNPLDINIEQESWQGYLTPNNQTLLQNQFHEGVNMTIELEATKVK